jgi:hypothetical protein
MRALHQIWIVGEQLLNVLSGVKRAPTFAGEVSTCMRVAVHQRSD